MPPIPTRSSEVSSEVISVYPKQLALAFLMVEICLRHISSIFVCRKVSLFCLRFDSLKLQHLEYDIPKFSGLFFLLRSQLSAGELFCITCCFSLTAFKIFSFIFSFWHLDYDAPRSVFTCFRFSKILGSSMFSTKFWLVSLLFL